jgi:adenosylhomocysteine nucleosidase
LASKKNIAIIAAFRGEIWPLVRNWPTNKLTHEGREFTFYESHYAVAVSSGIGYEFGSRAAEAAIANYSPEVLISSGVAGALVPELHVGDTVFPSVVVDTSDGSRHQTAIKDAALGKTPLARTILASYPKIAGAAEKRQLAKSYGAHAVDMEGAAVARAAGRHQLPFVAVKSISDELNFELFELNRFLRAGRISTLKLGLYLVFRPWLWLKVVRLGRNAHIASQNLCAWLRESALTTTIVPGVISSPKS